MWIFPLATIFATILFYLSTNLLELIHIRISQIASRNRSTIYTRRNPAQSTQSLPITSQ